MAWILLILLTDVHIVDIIAHFHEVGTAYTLQSSFPWRYHCRSPPTRAWDEPWVDVKDSLDHRRSGRCNRTQWKKICLWWRRRPNDVQSRLPVHGKTFTHWLLSSGFWGCLQWTRCPTCNESAQPWPWPTKRLDYSWTVLETLWYELILLKMLMSLSALRCRFQR